MLFKLSDAAAVLFAPGGGEDPRAAVGFGGGHGGGTVIAAVGERGADGAGFGADVSEHRAELLLVVRGGGDVAADDQAALDFHGSLGVVALLEAVAGFHDAAFRVVVVILVLGLRAFLGCRGWFAAGLAPGFALLGLAGGELFLVRLAFLAVTFSGAGLDDGGGLLEFFEALLATGDLGGNAQAVLQRDAVGFFGFGEEFGDLLFVEFHLLKGVTVADRAVLAWRWRGFWCRRRRR